MAERQNILPLNGPANNSHATMCAPMRTSKSKMSALADRVGSLFSHSPKIPRLAYIPADPHGGDLAAGTAIRAGFLLFHGVQMKWDRDDFIEPNLPHGFNAYIHRLDWARDLAAAAALPEARALAERLLTRWLDIAQHVTPDHNIPAWDIENTAWRLINLATHAPLLLASEDKAYRARLLCHMGICRVWLEKRCKNARKGKPRITARAALLLCTLVTAAAKSERNAAEKKLKSALEEGIYPDGGLASRSPLALMQLIRALAMVRSSYLAAKINMPEWITRQIERCLSALGALAHNDGGLGAWQGAAALPEEEVNRMMAACGIRVRPQLQSHHWAYQRLTAAHSVLIMDAGPPPSHADVDAGCASTLAIEFSHGQDRIIINCGGAALVGAHISAELAKGLRSTAAHSTLCLADTNSTAIEMHGKLGDGVEEVECDRRDTQQTRRIEASHDGYDRNFGFIHKRLCILSDDGFQLRGSDTLLPSKHVHKKAHHPLAIRFHLAPDIEVDIKPDKQTALLRTGSGALWHFHMSGGQLSVEDSVWVDTRGKPRSSWQLVIESEVGAGGMSASWLLKLLN